MVRRAPLEWIQWMGTRAQLKHVLDRLRITCVLDVGANEGQFGVALRGLGYTGWIISFEPVADVFAKLRRMSENDPRWRVFPYALGASAGNVPTNITADRVLTSFLQPRADSLARFPENRVERTETIEMQRLDDVIERCIEGIDQPRIYLKMDTQGFDLEVMRGGEETLRRVLALQTELSFKNIYEGMPSFMDSIREFQARGFDIVGFAPVSTDLDDVCAVEMDCIMARPASGS